MADFTTLTEATARDLIDLLRRDRSNPRGGPAMVGNFVPQGPLVTRWAKTSTTPDYPTYPSSGNVVGVKFGEYEPSPIYPGATATKTFTAYDPAWYEFATLENGSMPAVDTIVRCTWRDGRWWILQDSSSRNRRTIVSEVATARFWRDGDGAYSTDPVIGWNGSANKNVKLFPAVQGALLNDEGDVYEVVDAPAAYADNWLTLKQNGTYCVTMHFCWGLPALSLSDAETYLQQAAHQHTYTDNGTPMNTGTTAAGQALQRILVGIYAGIQEDGGGTTNAKSTAEQMYYVPGSSGQDSLVWVTVQRYISRSGTDVTVDLLTQKWFAPTYTRPYAAYCQVRVDQTSNS